MHKLSEIIKRLLPGLICSMLSIGVSCLLIRRLDVLLRWVGSAAGMQEQLLQYLEQVLVQLRQAALAPAWLPVMLFGTAAGAGLMWIRRKAIAAVCWFLLFVALMALAIALTSVNGVRVWALLNCFLPMLPHL